MRCFFEDFATTRSEGGPLAYPVPRNSTSNWAIATCLTWVFSFHPQPKHTDRSVRRSNFDHCSNQNTWSDVGFYSFLCFLWAPRLLYIVWVWNSHLVHHQCSITDEDRTQLQCLAVTGNLDFSILRTVLKETTNPSSGSLVEWKNWDFWATRELPTGDWDHRAHSIKETEDTHPKKDTEEWFFSVLFWKQTHFLWMKSSFYHIVIKTTSSTLLYASRYNMWEIGEKFKMHTTK